MIQHNSKYREEVDFSELLNKVIIKATVGNNNNDIILFECSDGTKYEMYHRQDCCEGVGIEDMCGNWDDILNQEILLAECVTNTDNPPKEYHNECFLWTFYKLVTNKGYMTIRWYGESNGYYSVEVSFERLPN